MNSHSKHLSLISSTLYKQYDNVRKFCAMRYQFALALVALATLPCIPSMAQKEIKDIRAAIKAKKPAEALQLIEKKRKDTATVCDARVYYLGVEAAKLQNEQENERIYLQQKPDTSAYFKSLHSLFTYAVLTDSAEMQGLKDAHKQPSHRATLNTLLNRYYPNLSAAAQYFSTKNDWDNARLMAQLTLDVRKSAIFSQSAPTTLTHQQVVTNAEHYIYACFASGHYKEAERYVDIALKDSDKLASLYEILALINAANKNEKGYRHYLLQGVEAFPLHPFFFKALAEDYFADKDYTAVVDLANKLALKDKTNGQFRITAAQAYDLLKQNDQSIQTAQAALTCDSTLLRAHLYIGRAYYRKARAIQLPTSIRSVGYKQALEQQKGWYEKARPHLETFRANYPLESQEWQPLLYEVYLKLNLGKEFETISQSSIPHKS